jgi:hypothetical protein
MKFRKYFIFSLLALSLVTSCKDKEDPEEKEPDPDPSYNFSNVDYSNQTTLITMMSAIDSITTKGNTTGYVISASQLKNMFSNTGSPFTNPALNTSGINLKAATAPAAATEIETLMDNLAGLSNAGAASDGVAGVGASTTSTGKYLLDANGIEYRQIISKMVMGATFYYQIKNTYLSQAGIGSAVATDLKKTNWDQAFGLYGVPKTFPITKTGLKYLGNYSNQVDPSLQTNSKTMSAFIAGRQAIEDGNTTSMNSQSIIVLDELEKLLAGAAILELRAGKTHFNDIARRNHLVSEGIGFLLSLKYIANANISPTEIDAVLTTLNYPAAADNLYDITVADLDNAIDAISAQYDLDAVKSTLRVASK